MADDKKILEDETNGTMSSGSENASETSTTGDIQPDVSVGKRLIAARELGDKSLLDISHETSISTAILSKLEKMDTTGLAKVHIRGHVKTYAAALGLPSTIVDEYLIEVAGEVTSTPSPIVSASYAAPIRPAAQRRETEKKEPFKMSWAIASAAAAAFAAVGVIVWGLTGTNPPAPGVSKSVLAVNLPKDGGSQSLLEEASGSIDAEDVNLTITATKTAWIEVRGADGTIFRSRKMAAGETYHPRIGSGWTVTVRDGSAFEWRVEDVSVGKLSEDPTEVFALSIDQAARQAAEILSPQMASSGSGDTQQTR